MNGYRRSLESVWVCYTRLIRIREISKDEKECDGQDVGDRLTKRIRTYHSRHCNASCLELVQSIHNRVQSHLGKTVR